MQRMRSSHGPSKHGNNRHSGRRNDRRVNNNHNIADLAHAPSTTKDISPSRRRRGTLSRQVCDRLQGYSQQRSVSAFQPNIRKSRVNTSGNSLCHPDTGKSFFLPAVFKHHPKPLAILRPGMTPEQRYSFPLAAPAASQGKDSAENERAQHDVGKQSSSATGYISTLPRATGARLQRNNQLTAPAPR